MKKKLLLMTFVVISVITNIFGQKLSEQETKELRNKISEMRVQIKDELALFTLKQDTTYYNQAYSNVKWVVQNLNKIKNDGTNGQSSSLYALIDDSNLTVYNSYMTIYGESWKNKIINDKEECNKKVNYKDTEYVISKMRKEALSNFLPSK